jgi:RimJ/RimL family protein N-acetyltransferase
MHKKLFPEVLKTERLTLRCYREEDAAGVLKLANENHDLLIREFAQIAALRNRAQAASFISEKCEQRNAATTFCYGIWQTGTEDGPMGQIQVKNVAWEIPAAELGYFIIEARQGNGYGTEAIRAILRVAFKELEFERIFVRILPTNRRSLALAKKLGFQPERVLRRAFRCGLGELHDVHYLSLIRGECRAMESISD